MMKSLDNCVVEVTFTADIPFSFSAFFFFSRGLKITLELDFQFQNKHRTFRGSCKIGLTRIYSHFCARVVNDALCCNLILLDLVLQREVYPMD